MRALLFDLCGQLLGAARVEMKPSYFAPHPGYAELPPESFWQSLSAACHQLWQHHGEYRSLVRGVALTTQRGTVINVDRDGNPLRDAILWLDQRRAEGVPPLSGLWGVLFRLIGMTRTVNYLQAEAEANWLRLHQPEIWEKTHKYLLLSGYLTYKLTGRFADSVGCQVGYLPFDYRRLHWAAAWDWKWQALPMDRAMLPELVPPGEVIGTITTAASEATGIPAGLPLIAAAADKACEVLGSGCIEPHIACIGYGTTATINTLHHRYVEAIPLIPPYPAAIPNAYTLETQITRGYWMVDWFKREFGAEEVRAAEALGVSPESLLETLAAEVPPGAMGLVLQPYWSPGIKSPGAEAKGAVIGFGGAHTRAHLYRAILEGIAYALLEAAQRTERRTGQKITELRVAGGGSQSQQAIQITADMFGLPAARPHVYEASGLGAAMVAAVGLRLHRDYHVAVREMTRIGSVLEPNKSNHDLYGAIFERVYKRLYRGLQPLYEELSRITGYPGGI